MPGVKDMLVKARDEFNSRLDELDHAMAEEPIDPYRVADVSGRMERAAERLRRIAITVSVVLEHETLAASAARRGS